MQCIYLAADGRNLLGKDGKKIKLTMGRAKGAVMAITPHEDVTGGLHISEGLETALTGLMAPFYFRPAWATGGTGTLKNFPVLAGIECLTIVGENDPQGQNEEAAAPTYERWKDAGRRARYIVPPDHVKDINDMVRGAA